jgi:sorbitol-specific phosphotransferase system component IIA
MDETRFTLNQTKDKKTRKKTVVFKKESDSGWKDSRETVVNKSDFDATLVGSSACDKLSLPMMAIFQGTAPSNLSTYPSCKHRQKDGESLPAVVACSETGAMTDDLMLAWLTKVLMPSFPDLATENEHRVVLICDGYGCHLSFNFLKRCQEVGVDVIVRPPHTSHKTQPEDLVNFSVFHKEEREEKGKLMRSLYLTASRSSKMMITKEHAGAIIAPAWKLAFAKKINKRAWRKAGIRPFSRRPYHKVLRHEKSTAAEVGKLVKRDREAEDVAAASLNADDLARAHFASEAAAEPVKKKRKNDSSKWWARGALTVPEVMQLREQEEERLAAREREQESRKQQRTDNRAQADQRERQLGERIIEFLASEDASSTRTLKSLTVTEITAAIKNLGGRVAKANTTRELKMNQLVQALRNANCNNILQRNNVELQE